MSPRALDFGISRAGFCKLPSSFHLMQPSYPLLQAVRHFEPFQPLSFLFPLGAPEEGFSRPGRTARLRRRREKARGLEAQAAVPKAKANAEVAKSGEASLAQPYVHRSKLPLGGSFPCISPGSQPTNMDLEGGVGVRRETTRRGYFRVQWGRWELSFQHPLPAASPNIKEAPRQSLG